MQFADISKARLHSQHLLGEKFKSPQEVVTYFGAIQAQDYLASKWGVGKRMENAKDVDVEKACDEGRILRTHIMRPTWHFVSPSDIRFLQKLTSPRVKRFMDSYNKKLELNDVLFSKSNKAIAKALENNNYMTRQELKKILEGIGIKTDVQRLAHIIMYAELDLLIVNGPKRGKQFTYALLEERVPSVKRIPHDEALGRLAFTYFISHGPAQIKDLAWWSGLTVKDGLEGVNSIKSKLNAEIIDGKTYWFGSHSPKTYDQPPTSHLLSIYDEYVIAYKDRSALGGERYTEKLLSMGNALTSVLILNGKIAGTWKRVLKKHAVEISIKPFGKISTLEKEKVKEEAEKYSMFLGMDMKLFMKGGEKL